MRFIKAIQPMHFELLLALYMNAYDDFDYNICLLAYNCPRNYEKRKMSGNDVDILGTSHRNREVPS